MKPIKIYIAARFSRRPECNELAKQLTSRGCEITSRWVLPDSDHVLPTGLSKQASDNERRRFALEDLADIDNCDWIVNLTEAPRNNSRGGRHVELGYALSAGKLAIVIGPRETVFHHLPSIHHFNNVKQFYSFLNSASHFHKGYKGFSD